MTRWDRPDQRRRWGRVTAAAAAVTAASLAATGAAGAAGSPGAGGIGDPYYPAYGNGGYDATHYNLFVDYAPGSGRVTGTAIITAKATQDLTSFNLDLVLRATSVTLNGRSVAFAKPSTHELVVKPGYTIKNGSTMVVKVTYSGIPSRITDNGRSPWIGSGREVVALGEPEIAAWWFPSNDHPRDKATYAMTFTVPKGLEAIGPGDFVGHTSQATKEIWRWKSDRPMATYLAFMAIGEFEVIRGTRNNRPFTTAITTTRRDAAVARGRADVLRTPAVVNWAARHFGPYPFRETGGVIANQSTGFALENQQRPVYTADFWDSGPNMYVVAHEIAHQWYGDSVSVRNWRDIWLNEGFATYAEFLWSEDHGEGTTNEILEWYYSAMQPVEPFWRTPISNPGAGNEFAAAVYLRGGMTLAALRNLVGDATLTRILRTWASVKKDKNGSTPEFIALAERIAGRDLDSFFRTWLTTPSVPAHTPENGFLPTRLSADEPASADRIRQNAEALATRAR